MIRDIFPGKATFVVDEIREDDIPVVADIHSEAFTQNWDEEALARILSQSGVSGFVVHKTNELGSKKNLGFVLARAAAGEAEVLTIAVREKYRGQGVARRLMKALTFRLYGDRCSSLFLEVDAANIPAVGLYKSLGFLQVGERKGYYRQSDGDGTALVMRLDLV